MKKLLKLLAPVFVLALLTYSCQKDRSNLSAEIIPQEVIDQIHHLGLNPDGIERVEKGYLIERDIIITDEFLQTAPDRHFVPNLEQYSSDNLVTVNGSREITIYVSTDEKKGFSAGIIAGVDLAIQRYNDLDLTISFRRVESSSGADIVINRLKNGRERQADLGSAGFPTADGDPYHEIELSGILESIYGLAPPEIATILAHQIGHCIGLRHTDYFDPSISCAGATVPYNQDKIKGDVGANHIPGTPEGATFSAQSFMLSCTPGVNRPFNADDITALNYLY